MVVNFDFDAFFDELKATKPPYKCPFKDCEKVYKTYTGIQYHVVTLHKPSNKTAKWHHRQMRCPITPPKSVSSAEAASEGEGEIGGCMEGRLEVEFGENKFILNDVDDLEIEVSLQNDGNLESEKTIGTPLMAGTNEAELILKEEPKKPLPIPIFSSQSRITRSEEFRIPTDKYIVTDSKDEDQENKLEYLLDEEDKSWMRSVSQSGVDEPRFELAMETMERESAFVTRCENRNHGNNNADADDEQTIQDDNAVCSVCGDGSCHASNVILFCDMCDMAVHQECYGVPYVPEGQWLCRRCLHSPSKTAQCCLCPCPGGALKQTSDGRWAHVLCSAWVPEINFANPVFLEPIEGLENIPPARWRLVCFLCRRKKVGACIQCHRPNCYTAFHVTCALFAGLHLEMTQRGTDGGPRGIFIPGHSSGNVRKTAYCDLHAPKPGRSNKSLKRDDTTCDPGSDDGGDDSEACEQIDEGRKLLAGDDEGDDDYEPGSVGKSKMDAVTKSRSLMTRIVTSKMKHVVGVLSYPTISQESFAKVSQIFEMDPADDFMQRLKNYWMLKRLSRNGVPLIRGLQPNLVPKEQVNQEHDDGEDDKKKPRVDDGDEDDDDDDDDEEEEELDQASTSRNGGAFSARHSGSRLTKESKQEDETIMLSLTCVDDDDDDDIDAADDDNGHEEEMSNTTQEQHETVHNHNENSCNNNIRKEMNTTSPLHYTDDDDDDGDDYDDDWDAQNMTVGNRKRKLAAQDVPKKRMKLGKEFDDRSSSSKSKTTGSASRRLRFYGDPGKTLGTTEERVSEDAGIEEETECSGDNVKRSKRRRKMSSALFDYTYFGSVQRKHGSTKSEEEKKTDRSFSSLTDDSFSKEAEESPKKVLNIKVNHLKLKEAKVLLNVKQESIPLSEPTTVEPAIARRGRKKKSSERELDSPPRIVETNGEAPADELCGAKHLREDLSKVKKILELVTQREECKREEVRVKTRMYSLKLDPLTPILTRALDLLEEKDSHQFFAEPVDTDEVSDYLDFISRPMDFGTMRGKIERHEYHSVKSFEEDVNLIISNCMTYNASGTIYYNAAVRLRNQGKVILNDARKAEEQLNALRKRNSTVADDSDGDELGTRSGNLKRGQKKEGTNKEAHLACIAAKVESVEKKLDSSSGFLRETYSRQLKHLNRQMAALKGRRKLGTSESTSGSRLEMPVLASEDESQNQVSHLQVSSKADLMTSVENMPDGLTPSQTAASPSSSLSFSISPPSLSPQAVGVSSSPVSSILSELPPSNSNCQDEQLRATGNDNIEFPIPELTSPPDVLREESDTVVCGNSAGNCFVPDKKLSESKSASDCGRLVKQGIPGSGSRALSEGNLSMNEDQG